MAELIFDWSKLTKADFEKYCKEMKETPIKDIPAISGYASFIGGVHLGDLCLDILLRGYEEDKLYLEYDLYVGGVDSGYGYADQDDGTEYPYDYEGGGAFESLCFNMNYDEFQVMVEKTFLEYIIIRQKQYTHANLVESAQTITHVW